MRSFPTRTFGISVFTRYCALQFTAAAILCAQVVVPPAATQATSAPDPTITPLKTSVTVTGTRTATDLDHSPVATSLVTREEIETRNVYQVDQALQLVEGVNTFRAKGAADTNFGVGLRGFAGYGSGQERTLILLDGQPLNNSYIGTVPLNTLPIQEFERIEVVRGPFSSLYGGNAMGGVVNLITRPVDHRSVEIFGQFGSQDTTFYSVHATDRFFHKLGLSFGYQRLQTGGYPDTEVLQSPTASTAPAIPVTGIKSFTTPTGGITYQTGERGSEWFNQHAYRGRAEYAFNPNTFASFQYFYERRGQGYNAYQSYAKDAQGNPIDNGLVSFTNPAGASLLFRLMPSGFIGGPMGSHNHVYQGQVLKKLSSRWNLRVAGGLTEAPHEYYVTPGATATLSTGPGSYTDQFSRAIYGSVQAGWSVDSRHQLIFGTETRQDNARIVAVNIPNYAILSGGGVPQNYARGQSVNQSVYVQDQIAVSEKFGLVVGGRYDYWRTYDGQNQLSPTLPFNVFNDRSANAFTGKVAGSYQLPAGFQARASVGNAFRNPTVYELYRDLLLSTSKLLANPNARPEHLLAFDLGLTRRFGQRANFDASYYENRVHDLLYRTTDFTTDPTGSTRRLTNAGLGFTRGVELAAMEKAFSWLQFKQTYTYTNATIAENPSLPATVGKHIPYIPSHTLSFLALVSSHKWTGSLSGRYQGSVFSSDVNSDVVRGVPTSFNPFFTADLSVGYAVTRHVTALFNVYDLLDRRYWLYYINPGRQVFGGIRIRL